MLMIHRKSNGKIYRDMKIFSSTEAWKLISIEHRVGLLLARLICVPKTKHSYYHNRLSVEHYSTNSSYAI